MNKEEYPILNALKERKQLDRTFEIPSDYWDDLHRKVMNSVAPEEFVESVVPITIWMRLRPLLYLAATFASLFFLIKFVVGDDSVDRNLSSVQPHEMEIIQDLYSAGVDEYSLYECYESSSFASVQTHLTSY